MGAILAGVRTLQKQSDLHRPPRLNVTKKQQGELVLGKVYEHDVHVQVYNIYIYICTCMYMYPHVYDIHIYNVYVRT